MSRHMIPKGGLSDLKREIKRKGGTIVSIKPIEMGWIEVWVRYA